jgi:hypothetical protein
MSIKYFILKRSIFHKHNLTNLTPAFKVKYGFEVPWIICNTKFVRSYKMKCSHEITTVGILIRQSLPDSKYSLPDWWYIDCIAAQFRGTSYINSEIFQAESVRGAAFGWDWVGTAIPFQRSLMFIMATANKEFRLTAGKFVPVSNVTTMSVCI